MDTQTQIDRLIELAIVQRAELKKLVSELPQLREHLNAEIERVFESTEPQLRTELEDWTTKQAHDQTVKLGGELEAKIVALSKSLEATTQTRYNAIMAERAENLNLLAKAEARIEDAAAMLSGAVKEIVTDELARFPRAGEIDQLRKEFAEPRGLNPRGRWEPGATYYKLDLVAYNGDSYVANEETSEKPNRNSSKWTLNAARGQAGGGGFMSPAIGDYTASMITNVPAGVITSTNVQDAINELAADVDVSQNTLDALVTNAESVAITKGQVVYAFGATGNRMSVKLALNTGDATSAKTIGVVLDSSIAAGATGNIRCVGVVDGLTLGSYTEGDTVYLGATAGSITATKPYAPNHLVYVGIVERANNGNGELYVKIQNGYELDEIHDVQITSAPLAGALLMRDATNSLWKANRLTGTTNQVTVTNADTAVTLSLPTSLASVDSITASASTALTLTGGSTGASLVLGQGSAGITTFNAPATGYFKFNTESTTALQLIGTSTTNSLISGNTALSGGKILTLQGSVVTFNVSGLGEAARFSATNGNLLIGTTTDAASLAGGLVVNGSGTAAAASSTVTGALRVTGGVGVSGAVYANSVYGSMLSAGDGTATSGILGANSQSNISNLFLARSDYSWGVNAESDLRFYVTTGRTTAPGTGGLSLMQLAAGSATAATASVNISSTKSASSSTIGAFTVGNGTAAANVAVGAGKVNIGSTEASTGSTSGALQVAGGIGTNNLSAFKSLLLSYDTGQYNSDATLSNYSATNGVYLNGNAGGWLRLAGSGGGAAQIQLNGGATGAITMNTATANALVLNGSTGAATFAGSVTANGQLIGKGTATNDSAATGYIGEYVEAAVAYGAAVAITTNTAANVTSISLTAGDWDIAGTVYYAQASGTTSTLITGSISSSSGVIGAEDGGRVNHTGAVGNASEWTCATGPCRVSLSGTTTYYLVAYSSFTGSTSSAFGKIRARRVR